MAYAHTSSRGTTYYLDRKVATLRHGREQPIYYFAKTVDPAHAVDELPAGYVVGEASSGLPVLKKPTAAGRR